MDPQEQNQTMYTVRVIYPYENKSISQYTIEAEIKDSESFMSELSLLLNKHTK